jgi:hypothetical protein
MSVPLKLRRQFLVAEVAARVVDAEEGVAAAEDPAPGFSLAGEVDTHRDVQECSASFLAGDICRRGKVAGSLRGDASLTVADQDSRWTPRRADPSARW